ncbi:saccharopine dehydrogenase NADP-binding domain-containing protein [Psychrobacillus sp.]|uniref:saccharopine dehydrogenase family protein n=1 Tax=Psychrobacillus sp. TaxID=1871623 RepID=UPI0028BD2476|nr:saccharopine dehydrogenase NADP-binding domain-containing protein [Psychrobacillus sp.]
MKKDIVVVGGYGHVGGQICRTLAEKFPGDIYAAGRSLDRAEQFCQSTYGKVKPLELIATSINDWNCLDQTRLVIMCIDQEDTAFARKCMESGIHYVDISANGSFLKKLEQLRNESNIATGVMSVGLAPGLTNLLAQQLKNLFEQTNCINISIMLGLGDSHGKAAIEWTVDNLNSVFEVMENSKLKYVSSFTDGRTTYFGEKLGHREAYRFPFSDQQSLTKTLDVKSVVTRLCFDSRLVTTALHMLRRIGLTKLLSKKSVRPLLVKMLSSIRMGSAQYAVKVDAEGLKAGVESKLGVTLHGENESSITAQVAVAVAISLYSSKLSHGIFHVDQLFELDNDGDILYLRLKETGEQFLISKSCSISYS